MSDIAAQIATLREIAETAVGQVDNYVADAVTASQGRYNIDDPVDIQYTKPVIAPWADPTYDLSKEMYKIYGDEFNNIWAWLRPLIDDWIAQFFPDDCVITAVDNWICNTITNGGTGIPAPIENAIWQRNRDRELLEYTRAQRTAVNLTASMGFSLPTGTLNAALLAVHQDAQDKVVTLSRDVAIKNIEIEIENIRFAVEQGVKLRIGILGALADMIRAYLQVPDTAARVADGTASAKAKLWGAMSEYYRAIIAVEQLSVDVQKTNRTLELSAHQTNSGAESKSIETRTEAAVAAANAMATQAAAALSALNTLSADVNQTSS